MEVTGRREAIFGAVISIWSDWWLRSGPSLCDESVFTAVPDGDRVVIIAYTSPLSALQD